MYQDSLYNLEKLDEEFIRKLMRNNKSVDFTGFDEYENGHSSPLMYCIFNNNKALFQDLLDYGADVNYKVKNFQWNALSYALRYGDDFFLNKLIETNQLDPYVKVNEDNNIEHVLVSQKLPDTLSQKELFARLKSYIKYLNGIKDLNLNLVFSEKDIFTKCYPNESKHKFIINNFPKKWLKEEFNRVKDYTNLYNVFKLSKINFIKLIDDKINLLDINKVDNNGDTIGHVVAKTISSYYDRSPNNFTQFTMGTNEISRCWETMKLLIEKKIDLELENEKNESIDNLLKEVKFYKEYMIEKNYTELSKKINVKPVTENKKIKI